MSTPELHFPHEAPDQFMRWGKLGSLSLLETVATKGTYGIAGFGRIMGATALYRDVERQIFTMANGPAGVDLASKDTIGALVRGAGYLAPHSVLIQRGDDPRLVAIAIDELDSDQPSRLCKPLASSKGLGIKIVNTPKEAREFVAGQIRPYLVEELLMPEMDVRYILHRDASQVNAGAPPGWRIAYAKVRPTIIGDGQSSVSELIERETDMPLVAKRKYARHHRSELQYIPPQDEVNELIHTGNVSQGAYGRIPPVQELNHLDTFMMRFLHDLEENVNAPFGTLCFDIGIRDKALLQQTYDHDVMKANIVFYEHQLPFSMTGYTSQLSEAECHSSIGTRLYDANRSLLLNLNLESSIRNTGRELRKQ
jgi:hypothetical protein